RLFTVAACSGLKPTPDGRLRGAIPSSFVQLGSHTAVDASRHTLVQMPNIAGAGLPSPHIAGDMGSELGDPTADRLI
ncbi:hypothetical protein, partial [Agrobacterium vitis]|uniref:hypothetical protein n=1 Tax=Agrobacterium vitis TaxID=373 RepID=UPI001AED3EDB